MSPTLYVFEHGSMLGNAPAHALFDRLTIASNDSSKLPRNITDYTVHFDGQPVAIGATVEAGSHVKLRRLA